VNSRTIAAVAACTRTLGEASDADTDLLSSGAGSIGALRAAADRLALRRRFHDESIHAALRPVPPDAAALYEALAQARLDALGVRWLDGIARNLLTFPGPPDDGARWLAFEYFSGRAAPDETQAAVTAARQRLAGDLLDSLSSFAVAIGEPRVFARAAAEWSLRAAGQAPLPAAPSTAPRFDIPNAPGGSDARNGRYALPGRTRAEQQADDFDGEQRLIASARVDEAVAALTGYRVYTTDFDRVVQATSLASREELERLRLELDAGFGQLRSTVARVAKRLMRVLMAKQAREWRFDLDDGLLDAPRLPAFIASGGRSRPFKQEFEAPFPSTAVTLLIDHSGSMAGRPMKIAALTVEIFVRVLERCHVTCEVLGFTTREWDGGEPGRRWADDGYPDRPGRLNALEHIVIKAADVPWRRARPALGLFLRDDMLKENIDGEAVAWAHRRLLARPERRRILIVVSDGTPMDEATFAANGIDYLDGHLAAIVEQIESRSPVTLAAIGIGHDVSRFYRNATRIARIDDLGPALTGQLTKLLGE
jgi:cobaltochelatase CobT